MDLVLASSSTYRARVLREAGYRVTTVAPDVDERSFDHLLAERGAEALALELAERKLRSVLDRVPATATVLAADQVGVLGTSRGPVLLTKAADAPAACRQLRGLSGTTHLLHNGLVVARGDQTVTGLDTQAVTFRELADDEIHDYVERFRPFDTAGSYRLEDDRVRGGRPFVVGVEGEDPSGVLGLPLPLLRRMLTTLDGGAPTTP